MSALSQTFLALGVSLLFLLSAHAGDRSPSPVSEDILPYPNEFSPKVQNDDFSCGFLALAAIYESYGLSPTSYRLRDRLGTSVPAIPFIESSTGTLQPDLFRVLKQDGFDATAINPQNREDYELMTNHLSNGHYALALVSTERVGGLHWIVFTRYNFHNKQVIIGDSLIAKLHQKPLMTMVDDNLLRVILLEPTLPDPNGRYWLAQTLGLSEMGLSLPPLLLFAVLLTLAFIVFFISRRLLLSFFSGRSNAKS